MRKLLFLSLFLINPLWAYSAGPQPEACPSATEIKKAGFSMVGKECGSENWVALQIDRYGRPESWEFAVTDISASSQEDATQKAKAALTTLSGGTGPVYDPTYDTWKCTYNISSGYSALAVKVGPLKKLRVCM